MFSSLVSLAVAITTLADANVGEGAVNAANWLVANWPQILGAIVTISSALVGLTKYPQVSGFFSFVLQVANVFSAVTHKDSPGTFKLPIIQPASKPPAGFVSAFVIFFIAFAASLLFAFAARADGGATYGATPPAPTASPAPAAVPTTPAAPSQYGGCIKKVCFAPSVTISLAAINLSTLLIYGALYSNFTFQGLFIQSTLGYSPVGAALMTLKRIAAPKRCQKWLLTSPGTPDRPSSSAAGESSVTITFLGDLARVHNMNNRSCPCLRPERI